MGGDNPAEKKWSNFREILRHPLFVAIVIYILGFASPTVIDIAINNFYPQWDLGSNYGQGELDYLVRPSLKILDKDTRNADIKINNINISRLYISQVDVCNSGKRSIKNSYINFSLKDNKILESIANVSPERNFDEYGLKRTEQTTAFSNYSFRLIKPDDGFRVLFLTDGLTTIKASSYDENYVLKNTTSK